MKTYSAPRSAKQRADWRLKQLTTFTAFLVMMAGVLALAGWLFDIGLVKSLLPGLVPMWTNTALGFVLASLVLFSLLLWRVAHQLQQLSVERAEIEDAQRLTDARLHVTLRSIGDAVIATDAAGRVNFLNTVAERLTGWTQAEAAGRAIEEVFHIINEQTRATVENPVTKVIREGVIVGLANHTILLAKDGREIPIDDSGAPIRDEADAITGAVLVFRDISERKQADKAMAHLAAIVESSDDAIVSKDLNGVIKSWNKGAEKLFGYTAEEAVGQSILMLIPPDRTQEETRVLETIRRGEKINHYETVRRRKDGSAVEISLTVSPLRDETGRIIGASKIARNISARKQAEAARQKLEHIFSHVGWAVAVANAADSRLEMVNSAFATLHGYSVEELFGKSLADIFAPESRAVLPQHITTVHELGDYEYESLHLRKDGTTFPVLAHVTTFRDETGQPLYRAATFLDLTERKRAEAALRQTEERLRLATEAAEIFTWEADLRTNSLVVSDNFAHVTGITSATVPMDLENAIKMYLHPDDAPQVTASIAAAIANAEVWRREYRVQSQVKGETRWMESQARVIHTADGTPERFVGVTQNITGRKCRELHAALLVAIGEDLAHLSTIGEIMRAVSEKVSRHLDVSRVFFVELDEVQASSTVLYDWSKENLPSTVGTYSLNEYGSVDFLRALAAGKPVAINDVVTDPLTAATAERFAALQIGAALNAPYISDGKLKFLFAVQHRTAYDWRADEVELMQELSHRIWSWLERARTEAALQKSEAGFRQLANAVPQIVWVTDTDGKIEYVNEQWQEFSGLSLAETATPEVVAEVIHPDDHDRVFGAWAAAFATGQPYEVEARMRNHKTGGYRWFLMRSEPTKDAYGNVLKWFGTSTDITASKEAEEQIRYQLALTKTITDNAQSCLWMVDTEGRGTFANPASERISGFKAEELIGQVLHYKIHPTRPDGSPFPMEECPLDGALPLQASVVGYEDTFVHKDGHFYPVRCAGRPIYKDGKPVGTVIEVQDITEEKRLLAAERKAREFAEGANRLKDEFLATVSHELRTPLNHMLGWVMLLRGGKLGTEKAKEALDTIERNVRAQNRLVEDLLDVSRIVTGKMQLHLQPVLPAAVVEAAVASARPAAEVKGVHLQVVLDSRPGAIAGDPDRLQQIVWNLVSNAIKFTPKEGHVQVSLAHVNSHVEITVSDTGEGIAPEFLPHVFNRFSQADSSTRRKHGGLGLGLAIVRHLVELHGGEVRVKSPGVGQGTTFTVTLPVTALLPAADAPKGQTPSPENGFFLERGPRLDGVRVLVVDDEADARLLLTTILADRGAEVHTAGNVTEALSILDRWQPQVLVSDIGMPNGDGYELIRQIRKRSGKSKWLPAVALTAYARSEDRLRALAAGFQMHVAKPVEPTELLMVVANLAAR